MAIVSDKKWYTTLLVCVLLLTGACRQDGLDIAERDHPVKVLGHGGSGINSTYPLNSYESIRNCIAMSADGVEVDIQMSRDGQLVLYHNQEMSENTPLYGYLNDYDWSTIRQEAFYDILPYVRYDIIRLEDLFAALPDANSYVYALDCKLYARDADSFFKEQFMTEIIRLTEKYNLQHNITIESADTGFLSVFQLLRPEYKLFIYPDDFETGLAYAVSRNLYGMVIDNNKVTPEEVQAAHDQDIHIAVWNTGTTSEIRDAIYKDADYIQTDNVKATLKLLGR